MEAYNSGRLRRRASPKDVDSDTADESASARKKRTTKKRLFVDTNSPPMPSSPYRAANLRAKETIAQLHTSNYLSPGSARSKSKSSADDSGDEIFDSLNDFITERQKEELENGLSSLKMRRWCFFEWFYSDIDRGYYLHNDFQDCLDEFGLGKVTKLARMEWSHIRSAMGKPRRLSPLFLSEERAKLEQHRLKARQRAEDSAAARKFPHHKAGSPVLIYHSKEFKKGRIFAMDDADSYIVELEDESKIVVLDYQISSLMDSTLFLEVDTEKAARRKRASPTEISPGRPTKKRAGDPNAPAPSTITSLARIGPNDFYTPGDLLGTAMLLRLLEKKEAVLAALKDMNAQAERIQIYFPQFQQDYAWLVLQLEELNRKLEPTLFRLRDRRLHYDHLQLQKFSPVANRTSFDSCKQQAEMIVSDACRTVTAGRKPWSPEDEISSNLIQLATHCATLTLALQMAEQARTTAPVEVNLALEAALSSCRPKSNF
eukprot:TRINITY_DN7161_c0_g1_i3.p2 TRINITY_DN7161_c0_g1~~TRINITY_DN7161_c0_g1_i3.p2  ORF type:complete len:487 (-),score=97.45 TRINITY_DN7161_c0_g1_i3:1928-3388(-)